MTVPTQNDQCSQRCDLILGADGTLRIVVAGDWIAPSEPSLIEQVFSDSSSHRGPVVVDLSGLRRVSPEIRRVIDRHRANDAESRA